MNAPLIEIHLDRVGHNARVLVDRLASRGIAVTGVTKAVLGNPAVAGELARAGVGSLGDSRIDNIEGMRRADVAARMTLIRSPMRSQVDRVVAHAQASFNTEQDVVAALSDAAAVRDLVHDVVLMVELGDLREGIMPEDLERFVATMLRLPNVRLVGLGANLACRSGVIPDDANMGQLTSLVSSIESRFGLPIGMVSGGNSATIEWALRTVDVGRVNDLRLGEAILLGREPSHRRPIEGLRTDAFTLVAEVIESKVKPARPWGALAQSAFGDPAGGNGGGRIVQTILAVGEQDVDPAGLAPPPGVRILGASSDHLVVATEEVIPAGSPMRFEPNYSALLRAMTSPFVTSTVLRSARSQAT